MVVRYEAQYNVIDFAIPPLGSPEKGIPIIEFRIEVRRFSVRFGIYFGWLVRLKDEYFEIGQFT